MKSNNLHFLHTRLIIFFFVIIVGFGGGILWWNEQLQAVDSLDDTQIPFRVENGQGVRIIATNLASEKLIRSPIAFFLFVKFRGIETKLQAGDFRLYKSMDARAIAERLTHGYEDVWVTTLEGWRNEEIANVLSKNLDIPTTEFLKLAKEGYMFPDTYRIPRDATAGAVVNMFRMTFDEKVSDSMQQTAKKYGLSIDEMVTLASMVEREGKTDDDRPVIAGVLLKRLTAGWPLQVDATLQYALGYQPKEKSWWKKALTIQDKSIDSQYNTYSTIGLPPAPICNPGLSSIRAVTSPKETEYWYYIHDPSGNVHFAETIEQHNANVDRYLR